MGEGLLAVLPRRPQALLIKYRRLEGAAAIISASATRCEAGQTITLNGKDSGAPARLSSTTTGISATEQRPKRGVAHVYTRPGEYTVELKVLTERGNADQTSTVLTVSPADTMPPRLVAAASGRPDRVTVTFSEPVDPTTAACVENYTIEPRVQVLAAKPVPGSTAVTLSTSPLTVGTAYTLTVNGARDLAASPHTIAPGSREHFRYSALYAWWRLDDGQNGTVVDSSGNGHHGTLSGKDRGPSPVTSQRGRVLSFDGKGDVVETDTNLADLTMPFTIAVWVNPASTQVEHADILGNHGEPYVGLSLQQQDRQTNLYGFGCGDGKRWEGMGPVQLTAGTWQHVAVVCDGHYAVLYVNGVEKTRNPASGPFAPNPNQKFKLGQGYHSGRYFHGLLSDARIYARALSVGEIAALVAPQPAARSVHTQIETRAGKTAATNDR